MTDYRKVDERIRRWKKRLIMNLVGGMRFFDGGNYPGVRRWMRGARSGRDLAGRVLYIRKAAWTVRCASLSLGDALSQEAESLEKEVALWARVVKPGRVADMGNPSRARLAGFLRRLRNCRIRARVATGYRVFDPGDRIEPVRKEPRRRGRPRKTGNFKHER